MSECLIEGLELDPKTLLDLGGGWTGYVSEVLTLSKPLEMPDMTKECLVAAFLAKVNEWNRAGTASMGTFDGMCQRCGRYVHGSIYSPDVDNA